MSFAVGRKTEEGFLVYKESELGITDQGGGKFNTPCVHSRYSIRFRHSSLSVRLPVL